ncbi:MAG: ankyrin repeat domain-containing protein [Lentisphaeria bacterium]|nr:ankyrin repeat domain-containing protein [Lentisphaeria bacterium]
MVREEEQQKKALKGKMKHSPAFGAVAACAVFLSISPVAAADFTSNSGKLYKNYRVIETTAQGVKIAHSEGLAYLLYSDLPYEVAGPYSADLQTRSGRVLKKYSVTKVSHKSLKILHDSGSSWIPHGELPEFLLKKYEKEIREEKARHEEKMKKMQAEAAKKAPAAPVRTIDFAAQTKAFLAEAGLTEKEIKELNDWMAGASAIIRKFEQEQRSRNSARRTEKEIKELHDWMASALGINREIEQERRSRNSRELPHVQYDPQEYARWKEKPRRQLPSKNDVLHLAIQFKNRARVAQMLEAGANPNIISSTGDTPLWYAMKNHQLEMIFLLLKYGADPNIQNKQGDTPLWYAMKNHQLEMIFLLLQGGVDINGKNKQGKTPLCVCIQERNIGLTKVFVAKGADPADVWDKVIREDEESFKTAEVLVSKGADCDTRNLIDLSGEWLTRYCKILYKEDWQTKEAEVKRMQAERERRRREAAAAAARARQNRSYGSGSGSGGGRTCPACHGSGRSFSSYRTRRGGIFDTHTSISSCSTCGGSGRY